MRKNYPREVCLALILLVGIIHGEDAILDQNHPKYEYGYVISHKEGGSQAHLETRNGDMALGRYYVDFPNGSGQKVTYLADDVGFHTGITYNSQTKGGSSRTKIAMGRKALATLENFDASKINAPKKNPINQFGSENLKPLTNHATDRSLTSPNANYKVSGGFYITQKPPEGSSNLVSSPSSPRLIEGSKVQEDNENARQIIPQSTFEKVNVEINQVQSGLPEIGSYRSILQPVSTVSENLSGTSFEYRKDPRFSSNSNSSYAKEKSIERTVFSDVATGLLSHIQKHAENIILKDMKKEKNENLKNNGRGFSYGTRPVQRVTMEPIVIIGDDEMASRNFVRSTPTPERTENESKNKDGTTNESDFHQGDSSSQTSFFSSSGKVEKETHQLTDAKSTNRNSDSYNTTLCESNLCERNNNRPISDSSPWIKPRKDIGSDSDISSGANAHKSTPTFYPQNQLKEERHYVTTIDVQKGISLEVQQNEDGSIELATKFPFNKLLAYQRKQHGDPTDLPKPIQQINSVAKDLFSPLQNLQLVPRLENPVQPNVETEFRPSHQSNGNLVEYSNQPEQDIQTGGVNYSHQQPQAISSGLLQDINYSRDRQIIDAARPTEATSLGIAQENARLVQPQQYSHVIALEQEKELKKQNFVEEERKQFIENLRKVEEVKRLNSMAPQSEVDLQSNLIVQHVTASPDVTVETNSIETPQLKVNPVQLEPRFQLFPDVYPGSSQNDLSNYGNGVPPFPYPNVQYVPNSLIYPKPNIGIDSPPEEKTHPTYHFYPTSQVQNVYLDNAVQNTATIQNVRESESSKFSNVNFESRHAFPQRDGEKVEQGRRVAPLPQVQINAIPVQPRFTTQAPALQNTFSKAFGVGQPALLLRAYPVQLQSASEQVSIPAFYHLPQGYQVPPPIQFSQPAALPGAYQGIQSPSGGHYRFASSYRGTNKVRVTPLKPSPPQEDSNAENIRNLLSQQRFQPTYIYANYPFYNRLQLRHIGTKKRPNFDQPPTSHLQSLIRKGKSANNLRLEYGFKPPLRPSVEFTEEVKPSVYGPSVPHH